jgi:branched-chain amino acid transport system substrate-binding protein
MQVMVEMLVSAMERARSADPMFTARALEGLRFDGGALGGVHAGTLRAGDHQFQQPLVVSVMERAGAAGTRHDVEGTGYGFRTVRRLAPEQVEMPHSCRMVRPD